MTLWDFWNSLHHSFGIMVFNPWVLVLCLWSFARAFLKTKPLFFQPTIIVGSMFWRHFGFSHFSFVYVLCKPAKQTLQMQHVVSLGYCRVIGCFCSSPGFRVVCHLVGLNWISLFSLYTLMIFGVDFFRWMVKAKLGFGSLLFFQSNTVLEFYHFSC